MQIKRIEFPLQLGRKYKNRAGDIVTLWFQQGDDFFYAIDGRLPAGTYFKVLASGYVGGSSGKFGTPYDLVSELVEEDEDNFINREVSTPGNIVIVDEKEYASLKLAISPLISQATTFADKLEIRNGRVTLDTLDFTVNKLLQEEVEETKEARHSLYCDVVNNQCEKCASYDAVNLIDGFADVAFVAINGIYKTLRYLGESHEVAQKKTEECLLEVCRSNLTKLNKHGMVVLSEEGKVMKPEIYEEPKLSDIIKRE